MTMLERKIRVPLSRKRADMPIIDGARMPIDALPGGPARKAWWGLWLKLLRPLVLLACWCGMGYYAWKIVSGAQADLPLQQLVGIYTAAVLLIALLMLALVRRRRRQVDLERPSGYHASTLGEVSDLAQVSEEELVRWQHSQRLVVHHDENGALRHAESAGADPVRSRAPQ